MGSLAGHACLPSLAADMEKPEEFESMLNASFIVMFLLYVIMGVFGYLLYGRNADVLVTNDLHSDALTDAGRAFEKFVVCMVTISSFSTIGPIVSVLAKIPEDALGLSDDTVGGVFWARAIRLIILSIGFGISFFAFD